MPLKECTQNAFKKQIQGGAKARRNKNERLFSFGDYLLPWLSYLSDDMPAPRADPTAPTDPTDSP